MGLFKKNKKEETTNENANANMGGIEILDLENENDTKKKIKGFGRENRLLFIIVGALILFVVFLPTITSWFSRSSIFSYNRQVEEIINNKTVDGMLEIGKEEGTITAKNIRFYNPAKKTNNEISIIYLPESEVKNVNNLNIYIELYNSNKSIIFRTKFTTDEKLERKVQGIISMRVSDLIYREATYAKITIIKENEFKESDDVLICSKTITDGKYTVEYKNTYNFSTKGLISYQISKEAVENPSSEATGGTNYKESFEKEAEEISKTNIEGLAYDEKSISYTVNLKSLEIGSSDFEPLYNLGNVKRQIKLGEEANKWSCK